LEGGPRLDLTRPRDGARFRLRSLRTHRTARARTLSRADAHTIPHACPHSRAHAHVEQDLHTHALARARAHARTLNNAAVEQDLQPRVHVSYLDFDLITVNRTLCDADGNVGAREFENIMMHQIRLYTQARRRREILLRLIYT
jgi:hypothetical protein